MMEADKISKLRITDKEQISPVRRRKLRYLWFAVLILLLTGIPFALYSKGILTPAEPVRMAAVSWVYPSQTITQFNASGYVVAQRKASVASKGTGRLEYLGVIEGSRVKEGDVIARLENEDLKAEKEQTEAQLAAARTELLRAQTDFETAQRNWKRYRNLWESRVIARANYENAEDQYSKSKALVESARANIRALESAVKRASILIEYTEIRAPFDGVVLTKDADVGEVVAPFGSSARARAAVATMADLSSLMAEADVSESFLSKVSIGQTCEIQLDSLPDVRFPGKVSMIVPTADRTRGTVLVKIAFDRLDPRVLPEMSAKVAFLSRPLSAEEDRPQLAVHRDALTGRDSAQGMFVFENGQAKWTPIPSPEYLGDYILMAGIMKGGEQVVIKPPSSLKTGDRIKVAE